MGENHRSYIIWSFKLLFCIKNDYIGYSIIHSIMMRSFAQFTDILLSIFCKTVKEKRVLRKVKRGKLLGGAAYQ